MQLANDKLRMEIDAEGRLRSLSLADGSVHAPIDDAALTAPFVITLRDAKGNITEVAPESLPEMERKDTDTTLVMIMTWKVGGPWGTMTVCGRVELPRDSLMSAWTLTVENRTSCAIWQIAYPRISGLTAFPESHGRNYMAAPKGMGYICFDPVKIANRDHGKISREMREEYGTLGMEPNQNAIAFSYPGMWAMQFMPFGQETVGGIYFAAHDGHALYKRFGLYGDGSDGKHTTLVMKQYPQDRTAAGAGFTSFYPTMIGLYQGEWWNASALYRQWALSQVWCRKGPVKDRSDIPVWAKNLDLWYWNWQFANSYANHPKNLLPIIDYIKRTFGCELAFHWYGCNGEHAITSPWRGPDIYPENAAIRRTLVKAVKQLHDMGVRCIPYINPRVWNEADDDFLAIDGRKWVAVNEHGKSADQWDICGHTMCPTAKPAQVVMRRIVNRMLDETGVDGAYLDQVSSCYAVPCFNSNHDHGPGGHDHWCRGYREMLEQLQKDAKARSPDNIFTSESTIECYLDLLDLDLAREISNPTTRFKDAESMPIPMFHSVYHDYHMTYGTVSTFVSPAKIPIEFEWFRCAEALCLVGGGQLMISGAFKGDENKECLRPYFDYMRMLTVARMSARKFFNLGVWKPPLEMACERIEVAWSNDRPSKRNIPSVLNGCFELDGELCVVLANHTAKEQRAAFMLNPSAYELGKGQFNLSIIHPKKESVADGITESVHYETILPALSAQVLLVTR